MSATAISRQLPVEGLDTLEIIAEEVKKRLLRRAMTDWGYHKFMERLLAKHSLDSERVENIEAAVEDWLGIKETYGFRNNYVGLPESRLSESAKLDLMRRQLVEEFTLLRYAGKIGEKPISLGEIPSFVMTHLTKTEAVPETRQHLLMGYITQQCYKRIDIARKQQLLPK